ncbi:hypothetical protein K439DRAFT_1626291 [Ramaria rubella]|nr:hypothetical protein K439DRAFT_1626291 [Ramaria rubella]
MGPGEHFSRWGVATCLFLRLVVLCLIAFYSILSWCLASFSSIPPCFVFASPT